MRERGETSAPMPSPRAEVWQLFARASIVTSLVAGFGFGSLLFGSRTFDVPGGRWWLTIAQAHGHAQLFGWATFMVLGVGIHFLPRLASAPPVDPRLGRLGFWTLLSGLVLRVAIPTVSAGAEVEGLKRLADNAWTVGAAAEFAGLLIVLAAPGRSIARSKSLRSSPAVRSVFPFIVIGFGSALLVSGLTLIVALSRLPDVLPLDPTTSRTTIILSSYGFLLPISVAMSARLFPLYLRTLPPRSPLLHAGLPLLIAGVVARLAGDRWRLQPLDLGGRASVLLAVALLVAGTGIFGSRRRLPRRAVRIWEDAPGLHALSAYIWLLAAGVAQAPGVRWDDVERHLLGMGFVTMLILGMGVHLLPGFVRRKIRHKGYVWATLTLGNLATGCRVIPAIPGPDLGWRVEQAIGATAGVAGMLAVGIFAFNVWSALASHPTSGRAGLE